MSTDTPSSIELAQLLDRFATMPSEARFVFQRHRFDGDALPTIASDLGVDCRTVEKRLADAMFHLSEPEPSSADQMLTRPKSGAVIASRKV